MEPLLNYAMDGNKVLVHVDINDFEEIKDCVYKNEHYSVRDNGSVMRHQCEGMRKRKLDNVWSFGVPNKKTGYMDFCGERVHRIVATAFHGPAPSNQHVVDHIDTNRQNNRPENLRWLTKLENILNNEITRKKVELICGSIEAFLENPSLLYGHETEDKNFSWMRNVTKEEARISLARLSEWAKNLTKPKGGSMGDWIYKDNPRFGFASTTRYMAPSFPDTMEEIEEEEEPLKTQSLTPNAIQLNWKYPVHFPCCPQQYSSNPLETYISNLEEGKIFSTNDMGESSVLKFGMPQSDCLWVMCSVRIGWKTHAFTRITFKDGIFYHENMGVYDIGDEPEEMFESILKGE
ncbi:MAG: HNH endonuclease [Bacteroidales bacterium]|nr:HNH endonuclease [Bacteroidales bacterium]